MELTQQFDDTLFNTLKECKTLPNFLDAVFGFLKRRTDFYCIATEPKSPVGLPEGWAEHFVKQAFFKWKPSTDSEATNRTDRPLIVDHEEVIDGSGSTLISDVKTIESSNTELKSRKVIAAQKFSTSESYNGAIYENYTWSQTISDIDIIVKLPDDIASKDLKVVITQQKITVAIKESNTILLRGELRQKVKHNDAIWSLDKRKLEIHLDKASEMWWDCLVETEPKLDVSKLDCSRPFEELPEEAQAKIEELTWNQERKRLGLPTSEQLILEEKMKKGWNVKDSPFKGPPDPSTIIIH